MWLPDHQLLLKGPLRFYHLRVDVRQELRVLLHLNRLLPIHDLLHRLLKSDLLLVHGLLLKDRIWLLFPYLLLLEEDLLLLLLLLLLWLPVCKLLLM